MGDTRRPSAASGNRKKSADYHDDGASEADDTAAEIGSGHAAALAPSVINAWRRARAWHRRRQDHRRSSAAAAIHCGIDTLLIHEGSEPHGSIITSRRRRQ